MKIIQVLFHLVFLLGLFGCMSGSVLMVKNSTGESVKCEGNLPAVNSCIDRYEAAGFRRYGVPEERLLLGGYQGQRCPSISTVNCVP